MTPRTSRTRQHRDGCADLATAERRLTSTLVVTLFTSPSLVPFLLFSDFWLFPLFVSVVVDVVVRLAAAVVVLKLLAEFIDHSLSVCPETVALVDGICVVVAVAGGHCCTRSEATIPLWMVAERGSSSLFPDSQRRVLEVVEEVFVVARL